MLDVRRDGVPLSEAATGGAVSTGITYGQQWPGMVPQYEIHQACAARHVSPCEWESLPWWERAMVIAWHRLHLREELHRADVAHKAAKRKRK